MQLALKTRNFFDLYDSLVDAEIENEIIAEIENEIINDDNAKHEPWLASKVRDILATATIEGSNPNPFTLWSNGWLANGEMNWFVACGVGELSTKYIKLK